MRTEGPRRSRRSIRRVEVSPKTLLLIPVIAGGAFIAIKLLPVFLVLVVALFIVGTLNPAVAWLERRGLSRTWGIVAVFSAAAVVFGGIGALTIPALVSQAHDVLSREPEIRRHVADFLAQSRLTHGLAEPLRELHWDKILRKSAPEALALSTRVVMLIAYVLSSVFLALYIMLDRNRLRGGLFAIVPREYHLRLSRVLLNLETIVGGYIRGQVLTSALMAGLVFVLLTACGAPNALAVAVFAGIADVLPYIGVVLTVGPAAAAAAARGTPALVVVVVILLAYEEFESRFLVPRIYGRALRLPSSVVLFSLLVGGTLMGIVGALLALPVAAALRMLIEELRVALPGEDVDDSHIRERDERAEAEYQRRAQGVRAEHAAAIAVEISHELREETGNPEDAALEPVTSGHSDSTHH